MATFNPLNPTKNLELLNMFKGTTIRFPCDDYFSLNPSNFLSSTYDSSKLVISTKLDSLIKGVINASLNNTQGFYTLSKKKSYSGKDVFKGIGIERIIVKKQFDVDNNITTSLNVVNDNDSTGSYVNTQQAKDPLIFNKHFIITTLYDLPTTVSVPAYFNITSNENITNYSNGNINPNRTNSNLFPENSTSSISSDGIELFSISNYSQNKIAIFSEIYGLTNPDVLKLFIKDNISYLINNPNNTNLSILDQNSASKDNINTTSLTCELGLNKITTKDLLTSYDDIKSLENITLDTNSILLNYNEKGNFQKLIDNNQKFSIIVKPAQAMLSNMALANITDYDFSAIIDKYIIYYYTPTVDGNIRGSLPVKAVDYTDINTFDLSKDENVNNFELTTDGNAKLQQREIYLITIFKKTI